MELILVRHGQPEWSREGRVADDPSLTDLGRRQVEHLADALADRELDEIVVSPLVRARETAAPLLARLEREPLTASWLAEIRNPTWEGQPQEHVEKLFAEQRQRPVEALWDGLEGGESFHAFHDRVTTGVQAYLATRGIRHVADQPRLWEIDELDQRIVLVGHAGANAVTIGALLGIPPVPWEWERFVSFHASVTVLAPVEIAGRRAFTLRRFSDVSHLPTELHTR